jgi:hypothetical protein
MNGDCCTSVLYGPGMIAISRSRYGPDLGGAKGTRTPDPLTGKWGPRRARGSGPWPVLWGQVWACVVGQAGLVRVTV